MSVDSDVPRAPPAITSCLILQHLFETGRAHLDAVRSNRQKLGAIFPLTVRRRRTRKVRLRLSQYDSCVGNRSAGRIGNVAKRRCRGKLRAGIDGTTKQNQPYRQDSDNGAFKTSSL